MNILKSRNKREGVFMPGERIMQLPGSGKWPNLRTGAGNRLAMARMTFGVFCWAAKSSPGCRMKSWEIK